MANVNVNPQSPTMTSTTTTTPQTQQQVQYGTWTLETTNDVPPFARNGHRMVVYKDNLYVYGGNAQPNCDQTGQIHSYNIATKTWRQLGEGPARTLHSAVVFKDTLVTFGGTGAQEVRSLFRGVSYTPALFNEVWSFNFANQQWNKNATTGSIPVPRDGHAAVVLNDTMYMFGGSDNTSVFCDLYCLQLERGVWMQGRSEGTIPSPRRLHSLVVWDDCLWVFGGYDGKTSFNDVYKYDIASGTWSIPRSNGVVPHKRYGHTAVVYKDFMYIFGGYGAGSGYRNDLLSFHFPTCTWTLVSEKATPPPRRGHTAEMYQDKMYVFGGGLTSTTYSNELWVYKINEETVSEVHDPLIDDLQRMLDNPSYYPDVVFKVVGGGGGGGEGKTIRAHKCILSARCVYFDSLFKSGLQESTSSEIVVDDIGEEAFVILLRYLYGGPAHLITPEVSFELMTVAEKYMLPHLKWQCESIVLEGFTVENIVTLLITSDTYKCARLKRACLDFISRNHHEVVKSEEFKTLPHTLLLEVMGVISAAK